MQGQGPNLQGQGLHFLQLISSLGLHAVKSTITINDNNSSSSNSNNIGYK